MKKSLLFLPTLMVFATTSAFAGGEGWSHDFEAAKKKAAEEKKDLLVDFTGSDWCGWCIKLNEEVFSHDAFKTGVADKFILVEIDFPRDKSKLSEETQKQNEMLQAKYEVKGFPTILLMDSDGVPFAKTGYRPGGPEAYLAHLEELQDERLTRDSSFEEAKKLEGVEKAKALARGISGIDEDLVAIHYKDVVTEIVANDPDDESGYGARMAKKEAMNTLQQKVSTAMRSGETDGVPALVDGFIADHSLAGEEKQGVLGMKMDPFLRSGKFDEAGAVLDEIIAAAPESPMAERAEGFKEQLAKMKAAAPAPEPEAAAETKEEAAAPEAE